VLELAPNSTLCEFILSTGRFSERTSRYFFRQMLQGLEYLHSKGWCHKDVKPENFLLDADFNVKLCDFGFSETKIGPRGDYLQMNFAGTTQYQAPEILRRQPHDGESADVFALGVCLFALVKAGHPFSRASEKDAWYEMLLKGRADEFWKRHSNVQTNPIKFSLEFMDLFTQVVAPDPKLRPTVSKIKQHAWYCLEVPSQQEVVLEMKQRVQQFSEKKLAERMQAVQNDQSVRRSSSVTEEEDDPKKPPQEKPVKNKPRGPAKPRSSNCEPQQSLDPCRLQLPAAVDLETAGLPPVFELGDGYDSHDYHYSTLAHRDVLDLLLRWLGREAKTCDLDVDRFQVPAAHQLTATVDSWAGLTIHLQLRIFRLVAGSVVEFCLVEGPPHCFRAFEKQIKSAIDLGI